MQKVALITGITGQDGAYLAEFLLEKGYIVHGIKRRSSLINTERIDHLYKDPLLEKTNLYLHHGDLTDSCNLIRIIQETQPDEIYNLGAMSHVHVSFETAEYSGNVDGLGTLRLLEAIRLLKMAEKTKVYQASTSELYGKAKEIPQNENTPFYPRSPYAVAKQYAFWITKNYREAYNIFASNGILFNHESPLRGETFVTRKISRAVARIALGMQKKLFLGNLSAKRDWGHAKDYVDAMWRILQLEKADDFVIATGITTEVREFVKMAFREIGAEIEFQGTGINEKGIVNSCTCDQYVVSIGQEVVAIDPYYFRPTEVDVLQGDPTKAKKVLGWEPKYTISEMVKEMVLNDIHIFKGQKLLKENGFISKDFWH